VSGATCRGAKQGRRVAGRLLAAAVALLSLGLCGCGDPLWPVSLAWRKTTPSARRQLGLREEDDRFKELDEESLEAEVAKPRQGLRLSVRTDKPSYQIGEPIMVDVRLENVSTAQSPQGARDIPVYFEPVARAKEGAAVEWLFKFQIRSDHDQRLIYRSPEVKVAEADRANYYHYVVLPPQAFVGRRFVFWPMRVRALTRPGTYSLVARYAVDEDSAFVILNRNFTSAQVELIGPKLAYVRVWTGEVFSNRATFRIERKKFLGIF